MKLKKKQVQKVKRLVERAIAARAESWDYQREIEGMLGRAFDGMDEACEDFAVSVPAPYTGNFSLTDGDVQAFFGLLRSA